MSVLDSLQLPLRGTRLIEASAGTGKTHTITTLFVRLVLERKLEVDRVLVVTFTNAATAELRDRIRKRLRDALTAFEREDAAPDPLLRELAARSTNRTVDAKRLARALSAVDEAAVLTIHGFCQRMLAEHAFDGGVRPELELVPDIQPLVTEIVHDFWNTRLANASRAQIEHLRATRLGATELVALATLGARFPDARVVVQPESEPADAALAEYLAVRDRVAREWSDARPAVLGLLVGTEALNRRTYPPSARDGIVASMDVLCRAQPGSIAGWSDDVPKLSAAMLGRNLNKGQSFRPHPFMFLCDDLVEARARADEALAGWSQALRLEVIDYVRQELPRRSKERSVQSFDDVLSGLRNALRGPRGRALAAAIRRRFPAALIDEFHDTDPVQYEIFRTIYRARGTSLFLIGDPKQAIYAFRGADVFAYLRAAKDADSRSTLATNHRSDPTMVRAVNTVFGGSDDPFANADIRFEPVATPDGAEDRLRRDGKSWSGLSVVFVPRRSDGRRPQAPVDAVPSLAASEIARALSDGYGVTVRDRAGAYRPLEPGDFAVLTRTNREAHDIQRALRALGIPSVLHGDSSVLDTEEAHELSLVLRALAAPSSAVAIRSALSTTLVGLDASELFALGEDEDGWEAWTADFALWHDIWKQRGFLPAIRRMMRDRRMTARLLRTAYGERKVTNLLHLTELCHRQATSEHLGVAGLLSWFDEVRHDDEARVGMASDAQQIRLESDERAVQLTTMHRSKGLEYPVVVLPSLWKSAGPFKTEYPRLRYHDPARDHELALDLRPVPDKADALAHATEESLAEALRLTYVALTRAKHRTIVLWGAFPFWHESAFARLVHPTVAFGGGFEGLDDASFERDLAALAARSAGSIAAFRATSVPAPRYRPACSSEVELGARTFSRRVASAFRTSSFSALTADSATHAHAADDGRDVDATPEEPRLDQPAAPIEPPVPLDEFPRGPRAGEALHAILEHADFTRTDPGELPALAAEHLTRYGFDAALWTERVTAALADVLRTPLHPGAPQLSLANVGRGARLSELEFTFPAAARKSGRSSTIVTPQAIAQVLRKREGSGLPPGYADHVAALPFPPLAGYLRGFIDLIFEHDGRFYVVDYKSNHLGSSPSDYVPGALERAMTEHHYFLQYHLYLVALHRYLSTRKRGYAYDLHMGGAAYLFLRGMAPERGPSTGVFFDRPPEKTIVELSSMLENGVDARRVS